MNLFVSGGAGFIGANFAHYARELGHDVLIYDLLTYAGNPKNVADFQHLVKGDIRSSHALDIVFSEGIDGKPFDAIVNFAAESHVDRSISLAMPFVETNVVGAVTLLEASRRHNVPTFIQVSTDEVYGSIDGTGKFTRHSSLNPSSAYSASKAAADLLLYSYYRTHSRDVRITRCTNNYGRFQHPEKFIPTIIRSAIAGTPIPIYGDGKQVRDWIFVDDHCAGILASLERGKAGAVYHFGGPVSRTEGPGISNIELTHLLLRILSDELGRPQAEFISLVRNVADRPGHDRRYALDWSETKAELNWEPKMGLEEGLRKTVQWWLANREWWSGV